MVVPRQSTEKDTSMKIEEHIGSDTSNAMKAPVPNRPCEEDHSKAKVSDFTGLSADSLETFSKASEREQNKDIAAIIESEIIPRLMLAHEEIPISQKAVRPAVAPVANRMIAELAEVLISHDVVTATAFVDDLMATMEMENAEQVFLEVLGPAARRLGEMWESDERNFVEVTIGLGHLQQLLRVYSARFDDSGVWESSDRSALIAPAPGEQHTFGMFMVGEFFRRSGWAVSVETSSTNESLVALVKEYSFSLLGLSLSGARWIDDLAYGIGAVREASCNPDIIVMVGGPYFIEHPDEAARISADGTALDCKQAVELAEKLVAGKSAVAV